jgi:hypothetical protein
MKPIALKLTMMLFLMMAYIVSYCQMDTIFYHNGKVEEATVRKIKESTITFTYKNEQAERSVSAYAIERIKFASGREDFFTDKIEVSNDSSWANIVILNNKEEAEGLLKLTALSAHTAFINLHTSHTGQVKAREKILKSAAQKKAIFLLITSEEETVYMTIKFWGLSQHKIRGVVYSY